MRQVNSITVDDYFEGQDLSRQLFDVLCSAVNSIGPFELRASKSQVAFRRRKEFASVWIPGKYLHGLVAPLVLTLVFRHRVESVRWKEIYASKPGYFTHHLELYSAAEVDDEVRQWLHEAWENAG